MASDTRLPIIIFAALTALIALPFLIDRARDSRRPVLVEARVLSATGSDPVYRTGHRRVAEGDPVEIAAAIRIRRAGSEDRWLSPAAQIEIDGVEIDHVQTSAWPEEDRHLRVFWFSVESTYLGGELTLDNAAERLVYRNYLAPEMGRGLQAERLPEFHNDDHIGGESLADATWTTDRVLPSSDAGTIRLYARVEVVEELDSLRPLQKATTPGAESVFEGTSATFMRSAEIGDNIDPSAAELIGLPGFEPRGASDDERNNVTVPAFGRTFNDLVSARLVVSSRAFAATAATGKPDFSAPELEDLGSIEIELSADRNACTRNGRSIAWGNDIRSGDLLSIDRHWMVVFGDNGDGVFDPLDTVIHSWGRPPSESSLARAVQLNEAVLRHWRVAR